MAKVGGYVRTDFKLGDFDLWSRFFLHTNCME